MSELIHKYGTFQDTQVKDYKTRMRKKIFWLILYTDPNTNEKYSSVNVVSYQENLMRQIAGLNSMLFYPTELVELLSILEAALEVLKAEEFNFKIYRKLVLDAGALVENLKAGD